MNYTKLREEIDTDPLARGYSGMTDLEVSDDINTVYREINREVMSASEIFNVIDETEWGALTSEEQRPIWDVLHMGDSINPFGNEAGIFVGVFGGGSQTIVDLNDARKKDVSRGVEIGVGAVRESDIEKAKAL